MTIRVDWHHTTVWTHPTLPSNTTIRENTILWDGYTIESAIQERFTSWERLGPNRFRQVIHDPGDLPDDGNLTITTIAHLHELEETLF